MLTFVSVGCPGDEEPRVVPTGRADRRDPTRELDERAWVEGYAALLEALARRGGPELVDAERGRDRGVGGIDRATREHRRARCEDERGIAPEDEHVEIGTVAHEDHRGGIADPLHGGSLRGPVTCPGVDADGGEDPRRGLPSVERVLAELDPALPHVVRAELARAAVEAARRGAVAPDDIVRNAREQARVLSLGLLGPVVNATGVLLHTNLGRAPLGADTLDSMTRASGYTNVEYRLAEGVRGSRHEHAGASFAIASGAEAGMVVNNNAAAVLLVLATLARGRSVLVSRGELIEIGGGFRIPEILAETGARLIEVGTTNRTRLSDYERARSDDVALVLKVHASNYRMIGFVSSASVSELAGLPVPVVVDAGSGLLDETTPWLRERPPWLRDELGVRQCIEAGAELVTFSGDKLLGGPQAGIIVGRRALVDRLKAHPLARALRADKLTLAGLQAVANAYLSGDATSIPLWRMACTSVDGLRVRAESLAAEVPGVKVVDTEAVAGGGTLPGLTIPSCGVAVEPPSVNELTARLRAARIVARVEDDRVVCDLRTVDPVDDARLAVALRATDRDTR